MMEADGLLTIFTIIGLVLGLVGAVLSQLWRASVDVDDSSRRKLTPAGWLLLGIALVGACGSIASELLRIKLKKDEAIRIERRAADLRAADERRVVEQRQALIENSIRQTTEIIVAGQPLTSMAFKIRLDTKDEKIVQVMAKGQEAIDSNARDVQGGVPNTPFEYAEYTYALIPLLDYLGAAGYKQLDHETLQPEIGGGSTVALLRLSSNAVLAFGDLSPDVQWLGSSAQKRLSSGFRSTRVTDYRYSSPWVAVAKLADRTVSYVISWDLDSVTLWNSIDRSIPEIPITALFPKVLQFGVFHRAKVLPFQPNHFSRLQGVSDIWRTSDKTALLAWPEATTKLSIQIEVNGALTLYYRLKRRFVSPIYEENGDELEGAMFMMYEFQRE